LKVIPYFLCLWMSCLAFGQFRDVTHLDHRQTPHLHFNLTYQSAPGLSGEALAFDYLRTQAGTYRLDADNLVFVAAETSLTATHYRYQQMHNGYRVFGGEIVVSILHDTGDVYRVYNNTYPAATAPASLPGVTLGREDAYDVAWYHLAVTGDLLFAPKAELVYLPEGKDFRLAWVVDLYVSEPSGEWRLAVDAINGKILDEADQRISRHPLPDTGMTDGIRDRRTAFAEFAARQQQLKSQAQARRDKAFLAEGNALVFDPDPRTTLNMEGLADNSPASAFDDAYLNRPLSGLELDNGTYRLNGPWITIADWDPPTNPPSTTNDGNWTATRGDNAFNDVTTYYHIHESQVYMQSLGFTGATGIQEGSIVTDTDGFDGADNSFFSPGTNRMSFGHGCVDDNEDADVILHEYGHAIHYGINSNWGGGDSGAIGEGFGDYWAGSYSYRTPNGAVFHPEWVYSWDGHNACWNGRLLNKTNLMYDPGRTYGAHQGITGGVSDELWSAPIFMSLLDLLGLGRDHDEMDQIVLESHFGLGSGVTMRVLGNATIAAAANLYPGGPHADVYQQRFLDQNIVEVPQVALEASEVIVLTETGGNGEADPGETVTFQLKIANEGTLEATSVQGTLTSSTSGVTINTDTSSYPDMGIGGEGLNDTPFSITLDESIMCGDPVNLALEVSWVDGSTRFLGTLSLDYVMGTGIAMGIAESSSPGLAITDNNTIQDVLNSTSPGTVTADFNVDVDITHSYQGDLTLTLRAPDGTEVVLHNGTGGTTDNIIGNYPNTLTPAESLDALLGKAHSGDWTLIVADDANGDEGTLNSWGINDITGYDCDPATGTCFGDLNTDGMVDDGDYAIAMQYWGYPEGDVNGSGYGTILDIMMLRDAYGACE